MPKAGKSNAYCSCSRLYLFSFLLLHFSDMHCFCLFFCISEQASRGCLDSVFSMRSRKYSLATEKNCF
jgi:hypothetical protein